MKVEWQQNGAREVVVVFGGWALGFAPFAHLSGENDVLFVDDFRTLTALPDLAGRRSHLVAYSLGVVSAAHWVAQFGDPFVSKTAINGTLWGCDDRFGVPRAFAKTMSETLQGQGLVKFAKRCGVRIDPEACNLADLAAELGVILARGKGADIGFGRVWQSRKDRILPFDVAAHAWRETGHALQEMDGAHGDFSHFKHWDDVIR